MRTIKMAYLLSVHWVSNQILQSQMRHNSWRSDKVTWGKRVGYGQFLWQALAPGGSRDKLRINQLRIELRDPLNNTAWHGSRTSSGWVVLIQCFSRVIVYLNTALCCCGCTAGTEDTLSTKAFWWYFTPRYGLIVVVSLFRHPQGTVRHLQSLLNKQA